ncbi:hypothetical protein BGZ50_003236 [Haplosporangium sp. Z 11]|nr:hypothetical protein BGZ50_003236 [Haplosporangium sp. Z 11]
MASTQPILRSLPKLPAPNLWRTMFKGSRARGQFRVSVMTEEAADAAVKDMQIHDHPQRSIIEIFPGPGQLTRSMALAGAKKVITVDSGENFQDSLKRLVAAPGMPSRNRVTLLAEAAAEITPLVRPGAAHFHLPYDYQLLRLVPHEKPKMDSSMEVMDFCLRSLFTNKSHPLNKVIKLLGPGAEILLGRLSFDHNIKIKYMTLDQLNEVALKFEQWPLRPTVLYDDMIMQEHKRKR